MSLSFPNDTEDATLGESFSAPTLTASPAAAAEAVAYSSSNTSVAEVNASTGAITLKAAGSTEITAAISGNATYKDASATYTLNVNDPNAPNLSIAPTSVTLSATANNPSPSSSFTVTGLNLTDGNYTIDVPSVAGLSVTPTSVTVADGAVNQEVTVTYAPSVDAAASSDDITLTINAIDATLTVNYVATLNVYTQETIDAVTTWDFVNDIDHDADGNGDVKPSSATATTLYANTSGIVFNNTFPKASLTWSTSAGNLYAYRKANKCSQGAVLSFNTSVPGIVTVLFANNGSGSQSVIVNDVTGEKVSTDGGGSGTTAIEESFPVDAGTVTITGSDPTKIRIFRIKFQPTVSGTITEAGWNTFSSNYALDLSTITGGTAYVAKTNDNTEVTMTKTTAKIAAGTGIMIKGNAGDTFTISTTTDAATLEADNQLVGLPNGGTVAANAYNFVFAWETGNVSTAGFYYVDSAAPTLPAGKAYLNSESVNGAKLNIVIDDTPSQEETDGIKSVQSSGFTVNGEAYNLSGQRVGADYKGLVIINGKKVIRK